MSERGTKRLREATLEERDGESAEECKGAEHGGRGESSEDDATDLADAACSGACAAGHFCVAASVSADGRARTGRAAVAGGAETSARRKLEDALVARMDAGDAPEDACAAALAAADLS